MPPEMNRLLRFSLVLSAYPENRSKFPGEKLILIPPLRKTPAATIAWRWLPTKNEHGGRGHRARH
eukprot:scaffold118478_cov62-Cyclotella_meneghiniana.AAC.9